MSPLTYGLMESARTLPLHYQTVWGIHTAEEDYGSLIRKKTTITKCVHFGKTY